MLIVQHTTVAFSQRVECTIYTQFIEHNCNELTTKDEKKINKNKNKQPNETKRNTYTIHRGIGVPQFRSTVTGGQRCDVSTFFVVESFKQN